MFLMILMVKRLLVRFIKKNYKLQIKSKEFRVEKVLKKEVISIM